MQEISKFSIDTCKSSLPQWHEPRLGRRQFIGALLFSLLPGQIIMAKSGSIIKANQHIGHFYWLDLNSGEINLPAKQIIDIGQPGSLMKLVAATAILQENLPSAQKVIDCRGSVIIAGKQYICRHAHGLISLVEAIGQSCNVFFAQAAKELNSTCFLHYLEKFGLGQCLHLSKNKSINSIDLILGLAEEYNFSAIQILQLISLIAEKGKPSSLQYNLGSTTQQISLNDPQLNPHTWNVLQTGMQIAAQRGTAKNLDRQNKLHLAVKTGTTLHGGTYQSWLAGYFPYQSPRYVFCLRANVGTSYDSAVPLAKKYLFARNWT